MNTVRQTILAVLLLALMPVAHAAFIPFNSNVAANIGIGTTTPQGSFVVMSGNVGIGSIRPGTALDVVGTVRATSFIGNGSGLTGISASNWIYSSSGNVGLSTTANVGIGTSFTSTAGLSIMNGNVGIGTWLPTATLTLAGQMNWATGLGSSLNHIAGPSDQALNIIASAPAQAAATTIGNAINITASNATAGSVTTGAAAGGAVNINAGNAAQLTTGTAGGGNVNITAGFATGSGGSDGTVFVTGGSGGANNFGGGVTIAGGAGTGGGTGGTVSISGGAGVGTGGSINLTSGTIAGSNFSSGSIALTVADVSSNTQSVGSITIKGGKGNYTTNTNSYGSGGSISIITQAGAGNSSAGTTDTGGPISFTLGTGGNDSSSGPGGSGGAFSVTGGAGGTSSSGTGGIGSSITLTSGAGGASSGATGGASGSITLQTAAAGTGSPAGSAGTITLGVNNGTNLFINGSGNVGISSTAPGQALDVNGTVRATNFIGNGSGLTGLSTGLWATQNTTDQSLAGGNVGIGTTITNAAALSVMNGNVGIGTWVPAYPLYVNGNADVENTLFVGAKSIAGVVNITHYIGAGSADALVFQNTANSNQQGDDILWESGQSSASIAKIQVLSDGNSIANPNMEFWVTNGSNLVERMRIASGNVGIGSWGSNAINNTLSIVGNIGVGTNQSSSFIQTSAPNGGMIVQGNVGIGSVNPGQALDVNGTVRATHFVGDGSALTGVGGGSSNWTYSSSGNVGLSTSAAVGIGTTFIGGANGTGLSIMNGNVGIGTWVPGNALQVNGNIGIGTFNSIVLPQLIENNTFNNVIWTERDRNANITDTTTTDNVIIGYQADEAFVSNTNNEFAADNTIVGALAANSNVQRQGVTAIGYAALYTMNGGNDWTAVGRAAGYYATGNNSSFFGSYAGQGASTYTQPQSTAVGYKALFNLTNGIGYLTSLGYEAGYTISSGSANTVIGAQAGYAMSTAQYNTALGENAGYPGGANGSVAGSDNTWIGANSGPSGTSDVSNSVGIGSYATAGANNVMVLGGMGGYALNVGIGTDMNGAKGSLIVLGNNVGIGSVLPGQALDVQGTVRATNFVGNGSGLTGISGGLWTTTNTNDVYEANGSTWGNVGIGTSFTNSSAALSVMNGNVGIGTWVPNATLEVGTGANFVAIFNNGSIGATTTSGAFIDVNGGYSEFGNSVYGASGYNTFSSSVPATISVNNAEALRIINGGNVGIGTITPAGGLTVMNGNVGIGTWVPLGILNVNTLGGNVGIGTVTSTAAPPSALVVSGGVAIGSSSGYVKDYSAPNNGLIVQGQVGIGTFASNGNALHVKGSADFSSSVGAFAFISGPIQYSGGTTASYVGGNMGIGTTTPQAALAVTNGNVGIGTWIATGGSLIVASGNVGIGSLTPGQVLDVNGTVRATHFVGDGSALTGVGGGSSNWTYSSSGNVGLSTTANVGIGTSFTSTAALTVMNGNVGIGTWVPAYTFQVKGGTLAVDSGSGTDTLEIRDGTITKTAGGDFTWNTGMNISSAFAHIGLGNPTALGQGIYGISSNGNIVLIPAAGFNVGIGTQAPTGFEIESQNVGIGTWVAPAGGSNNLVVWGNVGVGTTKVGGTGEAALSIMNGNVGIGTWVPSQELHIAGSSPFIDLQNTISANGFGGIRFANNTNTQGALWTMDNNISSLLEIENPGATSVFVIDRNSNVGIGTITPVGGLAVMNGNVGIGTWVPGSALQVNNTMTFQSERSDGNSGTSLTINWNNANKQKVTLTGNCTFTFTAPASGIANVQIKLVQDGTGSRTVTWPGTVEWSGGTAPVLSTAAAAIDIVTCYYDGTNYFCAANLNFQV